MKKIFNIIATALILFTFLGCHSEKKATYYNEIYSEKPITIYIAPVNDKTERKAEKYPKDVAYNNEVNTAAKYCYQTMAAPLMNHGYYVIGPVASNQISTIAPCSPKQLCSGDIKQYYINYGIDAVLVTTLYKWVDKNGKWTLYMEYLLRSTKTNTELMHKWVMATKEVPTNLKGDPIEMQQDKSFAKTMGFDNGTAQRAFLVEKVNDYVLRNIPLSASLRQFEDDLYKVANATYVKYTWSEEGKADVEPCSLEEYEQGCFL